MKGLNSVFPIEVQQEVRNTVEIKKAIVKAYFQLSLKHTKILDATDLRHDASNYNSIIHSQWYTNLKSKYGEAIHMFLKFVITNKLNNCLIDVAGNLMKDLTKEQVAEIQDLRERLEFDSDCFRFQIERLEANNLILETEVEELQEETKTLKLNNTELNNRLEVVENDNNALSGAVKDLLSQVKEAGVQLEDTRVQLEDTRVQLEDTRVQLVKAGEKIEGLTTRVNELEVEVAKLNTFDFKQGLKDIREANEMFANAVRKVTLDLSEVAEECSVSITDARVKAEMLDRVVTTKNFTEEVVTFTLAIEETHKVNVDDKLHLLDALILQAEKLQTKLIQVKKKILPIVRT
jgi:chromosome segregation ATPase